MSFKFSLSTFNKKSYKKNIKKCTFGKKKVSLSTMVVKIPI